MNARQLAALVVASLAVTGCHRFHGRDGERDAGSAPISTGPDAAPPPADDGPPDGGVCQGLPSPEFRIVQIGTEPCDRSEWGGALPMRDLRITAAPDLDGVRIDYNTSFTLEPENRCRIELLGVGSDVAVGTTESWVFDGPTLELLDSGLLIRTNAVCDACDACDDNCSSDIILWVGEVALPAQGPHPEGGFADWLFLTDVGQLCSAPISRCTQSLHEVEVRAELTGTATLRVRPGETRVVGLSREHNRLHVRLFDTPRTCGPADGGGELFASLVAWRSYEEP